MEEKICSNCRRIIVKEKDNIYNGIIYSNAYFCDECWYNKIKGIVK